MKSVLFALLVLIAAFNESAAQEYKYFDIYLDKSIKLVSQEQESNGFICLDSKDSSYNVYVQDDSTIVRLHPYEKSVNLTSQLEDNLESPLGVFIGIRNNNELHVFKSHKDNIKSDSNGKESCKSCIKLNGPNVLKAKFSISNTGGKKYLFLIKAVLPQIPQRPSAFSINKNGCQQEINDSTYLNKKDTLYSLWIGKPLMAKIASLSINGDQYPVKDSLNNVIGKECDPICVEINKAITPSIDSLTIVAKYEFPSVFNASEGPDSSFEYSLLVKKETPGNRFKEFCNNHKIWIWAVIIIILIASLLYCRFFLKKIRARARRNKAKDPETTQEPDLEKLCVTLDSNDGSDGSDIIDNSDIINNEESREQEEPNNQSKNPEVQGEHERQEEVTDNGPDDIVETNPEIDELKDRCQSLENIIKELEIDLTAEQDINKNNQTTINSLLKEVASLKEAAAKNIEDKQAQETIINQLKDEHRQQEEKLKEKDGIIASSLAKSQEDEQTISSLRTAIDKVESDNKLLVEQNKKAAQDYIVLENKQKEELARVNDDHNNKLATLQQEHDSELSRVRQELQAKIDRLQESYNQAMDAISQERSSVISFFKGLIDKMGKLVDTMTNDGDPDSPSYTLITQLSSSVDNFSEFMVKALNELETNLSIGEILKNIQSLLISHLEYERSWANNLARLHAYSQVPELKPIFGYYDQYSNDINDCFTAFVNLADILGITEVVTPKLFSDRFDSRLFEFKNTNLVLPGLFPEYVSMLKPSTIYDLSKVGFKTNVITSKATVAYFLQN